MKVTFALLVIASTALADVPYGPKPVGCNDYEVIIGRGTGERGPFGSIVGDPLYARLKRLLPSVRGYAVQYPAAANAESVNAGRDDIVKRLTSQAKACPKQKFAIVGYSQGARILRMAMKEIGTKSPQLLSKVVAIATYGDPGARGESAPRAAPALPEVLRPRTVINCVVGDAACDANASTVKTTGANGHLKYNKTDKFHKQSADFIVAGFTGKPFPSVMVGPQVV